MTRPTGTLSSHCRDAEKDAEEEAEVPGRNLSVISVIKDEVLKNKSTIFFCQCTQETGASTSWGYKMDFFLGGKIVCSVHKSIFHRKMKIKLQRVLLGKKSNLQSLASLLLP